MQDLEIIVKNTLTGNPPLLKQAKIMYLSGQFYPTEICEKLGVDINELGLYVFGANKQGTTKTCWKYMLDNGDIPNYVSTYEEIKPHFIKKTEKKLLDKINEVVDCLVDAEDMDTKDLVNLVGSYEKVDRIGRLEEGKSTSNVMTQKKTFSLRDIIASKKEDIEDANYTELPSNRMPEPISKEESE